MKEEHKIDPFLKPRKCRYCDKPARFNSSTGRYGVLCGSEECSAKAREQYKINMMKKFGTHNLMSVPEYQVRMAKGRAITYKWSGTTDEKELKYCLSSYEIEVCKWLDKYGFSYDEVLVGEKTLEYKYKGTKHIHIIDFYIPELNLIISVKDSPNNPNTRPSVIKDRLKNRAQYEHILKKTDYSFIQLEGIDQHQFDRLNKIIELLKANPKKRYTYKPVIDYIEVIKESFGEYYLSEHDVISVMHEYGIREILEGVDYEHTGERYVLVGEQDMDKDTEIEDLFDDARVVLTEEDFYA